MTSRDALALLAAAAAPMCWAAIACAEPPPDRPVLHAGDPAEVDYNGTWYPATVLSEPGVGFWQVSYDGYGPEWNEVVGAERIRRRAPPGATVVDPVATSKPVRAVSQLRTGARVLVLWGERWWPARVVAVRADATATITYDGYGSAYDEAVGLDRLRLPIRAPR